MTIWPSEEPWMALAARLFALGKLLKSLAVQLGIFWGALGRGLLLDGHGEVGNDHSALPAGWHSQWLPSRAAALVNDNL